MYQYRYAWAWAILILLACGLQPSTLNKLRLEDLFSYDKPIHALLFGTQAWLLIKAYKRKYITYKLGKRIWQFCLLSAMYGVLIEVLQKWLFVGRSFDYFDMTANTLGCVIVYLVMIKTHKHV